MMFGTHLVFGAALYTAAAAALALPTGPEALGAAAVGSLLPDIDHPKSYFGQRFRIVSAPLAGLVGHRGVTHSAVAVLVCTLLAAGIVGGTPAIVTALALGYLSHLIGDWMTTAGIPLLWPRRTRYKAPVTFRTGSLAETLLFVALAATLGYAY